jgi:hypothetical protein
MPSAEPAYHWRQQKLDRIASVIGTMTSRAKYQNAMTNPAAKPGGQDCQYPENAGGKFRNAAAVGFRGLVGHLHSDFALRTQFVAQHGTPASRNL